MNTDYSFQEEFANSDKNFRYLVGGQRCGKTIAGAKAVCNLILKGKSGVIVATKEEISSIKNQIRTVLGLLDTINLEWQGNNLIITKNEDDKLIIKKKEIISQVKFLSTGDTLTGIATDWIWLNKTTMYDEWRIWNFLVSRLRNYPSGGTLIITEEKSLLLALINKEKYNMVLMDWKELSKFNLLF
jgi:hypothetical protein